MAGATTNGAGFFARCEKPVRPRHNGRDSPKSESYPYPPISLKARICDEASPSLR